MRADMAKVIVERPRHPGWGSNKPKGYRKYENRNQAEGLPRCEGMKRRWKGGTKHFNEHLGPLRRYLESQVGRPWDKVFSEISAHISRDSVVQDHVRDHVMDYVTVNVVLLDGVPCYAGGPRGWGRIGMPLHEMWGAKLFYVCPRSGLLKKVKRVPRRQRRVNPTARQLPSIRVDETHLCRFLDGAWYLVEVQRFPGPADGTQTVHDPLMNRSLTREEAVREYGAAVFGVARRLLGKREMKQYPIPIDWQR